MLKKTTILIAVALFALASWSLFAYAQQGDSLTEELLIESAEEMPASGTTNPLAEKFATAQVVEESTSAEGVLNPGEADYFKITLNSGYQVKVTGMPSGQGDLKISLYEINGGMLSTSTGEAAAGKDVRAYFYKGATSAYPTENQEIFIQVLDNAVEGTGVLDYTVEFERVDRSDAYANTDAGGDFTTAVDLQLTGEETAFSKNFLGKNNCGEGMYCSTDAKDIYLLSMTNGESISLIATPSSELSLDISIYDEDENILESTAGKNTGAITEIEYVASENQTVFIALTSSTEPFFGSYSMDIMSEAGAVVATSPTASATPAASVSVSEPPPEIIGEKPSEGFNIWDYKLYIIIGGIVVAAVIIILVFLSIRKRKNGSGGATTSEIEKLRTQMRSGEGLSETNLPRVGKSQTMHDHMQKTAPAPAKKSGPPQDLPSKPAAPAGSPAAQVKQAPLSKVSLPPSSHPPTPISPKPKAPAPPATPAPEAQKPSPTKGDVPVSKAGEAPGAIKKDAQKDIDDIFGA